MCWAGLLVALFLAGVAGAQERPAVDFWSDVEPLFRLRCYECHGPDERKGGLRLTNRTDAFTPGDYGIPVLSPGSAEHSLLFELVTSDDPEERMPHDRPPLDDDEIDILRRWIDQGAPWPDGERPRHWAYVPPKPTPPPAVEDERWPRNEIDTFVLARLEAAGIEPSPPEEPARLLRRLALDLTGLPPSPEQVLAFEAEPTDEAYEAFVDQWLASPAFGERWATPWLDLARYADTNGYQRDRTWSLWPYRDWVIDALNQDLPFDEFTVAQLAGDLLPNATLERRIATGFHRAAPVNIEVGVDPEEDRVLQVIDRVNTTATVWLGTTLECAQCHDHKYDPFSQADYYRFFAFFNGSPMETERVRPEGVALRLSGPKARLPLQPAQRAERERLEAALRSERKALFARRGSTESYERWKRELEEELRRGEIWTTSRPVAFASSEAEEGALFLSDGSVVVTGAAPDVVTHRYEFESDVDRVTGVRILFPPEARVTPEGDPLEPRRSGPGNPRINELELLYAAESDAEPNIPVELFRGFGTPRRGGPPTPFPLRALDGRIESEWRVGVQLLRDRYGVLTFEEPVEGARRFALVMEQSAGAKHVVDQIQFAVSSRDRRLLALPNPILARLAKPERSPEEERDLRAYYFEHGTEDEGALSALQTALERVRPHSSRVMEELPERRRTHVLVRGQPLQEGREVRAATPAALHLFPDELPRDRLGLARWLVDPSNPLTARVTINRWWAQLFGRGLVDPTDDFGTRAESPTHPALLDALAVDFVGGGWRMKRMIRQMVLSSTYRQSSRWREEVAAVDPDNVLYARMARRRLTGEMARDHALAVSGLLEKRLGGPPVHPPQPPGLWDQVGTVGATYPTSRDEDRFRRAVYVVRRRSAPYPSFANFDAPSRTKCTAYRTETNTPLQALTLLNDPAFVEMTGALARRILVEMPAATPEDRIEYAVRLVLARAARPDETSRLRGLYDQAHARFALRPEDAASVLAELEMLPYETYPNVVELAAWFEVAGVLLNLDEAVTRS